MRDDQLARDLFPDHDRRSARATIRYWRARNCYSNYRRSWADWFVELVAKRRAA